VKLIDTNRYYLPGTSQQWMHLASVHYGVREFMCFIEVSTQKVYIEEVTGGSLEFINDDMLAEELAAFLREHNILDPRKMMYA